MLVGLVPTFHLTSAVQYLYLVHRRMLFSPVDDRWFIGLVFHDILIDLGWIYGHANNGTFLFVDPCKSQLGSYNQNLASAIFLLQGGCCDPVSVRSQDKKSYNWFDMEFSRVLGD